MEVLPEQALNPVDELFEEPPNLHRADSGLPACWALKRDSADFIYKSVGENSITLETGAGVSTLVFALRKSSHTAVTPSGEEIRLIAEYAASHSISMSAVTFANATSESYLPTARIENQAGSWDTNALIVTK